MEDVTNFTLADAAGVLDFWKDFNLDTRRLTLDQNCVDMREMKTSSINGRKRLNDATKSFRGKNRDEQTSGMTELLKLYQEEIDQLSRRSKFSESAFYSLYKSIYDAPNPSVSIEGLIDMVAATSTNQLEIERLKGELSQYDKEFQNLKNQDITIRRLEDQLEEYRDQIEDKVMEEVFRRTSEINVQSEEKISEVRELQRTSERRLAAVVESMKQAQSTTDRAQTQMFEISTQAEERVSALSAENAMLAEGTERAHRRVAELEGEISALRTSLTLASSSNSGATQRPAAGSSSSKQVGAKGEDDYDTLQLVIVELRHEIRSKEDSMRVEKQRMEGKNRETIQLLSREREALGKVKLELAERPTKEDISSLRRQVKMLQRVAFNAQEDDESEGLNMESKTIPSGDVIPLEMLLTSRMKALDTELAECKRSLRDAKMHEASAKETAASLRATVEKSSGLIARLEADLETQIERRGGRDSGPIGKKNTSQSSLGGQGGGAGGSMELSELLGVDIATISAVPGALGRSGAQGGVAGGGGGSTAPGGKDAPTQHQQMVDILQAQRDRYKDRLASAENVVVTVQHRLEAAESSKAQLEQDNIALYSKIRYLQSLSGGAALGSGPKPMRIRNAGSRYGGHDEESSYGSSSSRSGRGRTGGGGGYRDGVESMEDEGRDRDREVEGRYDVLYEQRMNPFAEFSQIEKQRRLQELSVADRMVLNTALAFVSSKSGRSFVVIYLAAMHLLVFFILYYYAHHVQHGCDPAMDALHRGGPIGGHLER